jgi:hypothetical protein
MDIQVVDLSSDDDEEDNHAGDKHVSIIFDT